ncbi:hypothetical protein C8R44DRAFT_848162 [Mycena epipterygia]|nr:hypothetical protein C8R44DRAFT_848162 [Mycena epipterygia]
MSSHLAIYVRHLHIGLVKHHRDYGLVESALRIAASKITLFRIFYNGVPFDWNIIPPNLATLLNDIVLQPTTHLFGTHPAHPLILHPSPVIQAPRKNHSNPAIGMHIHGHLKGLRKLSLLDISNPDTRWMPLVLEPAIHPTLQHLELSSPETHPSLAPSPLISGVGILHPHSAYRPRVRVGQYSHRGPSPRRFVGDRKAIAIHFLAPGMRSMPVSLGFVERLPSLHEVHFSLNRNSYRKQGGFKQPRRLVSWLAPSSDSLCFWAQYPYMSK